MINSKTCSSIRAQVNREKKPTIEGKHEVERFGLYYLDSYTAQNI